MTDEPNGSDADDVKKKEDASNKDAGAFNGDTDTDSRNDGGNGDGGNIDASGWTKEDAVREVKRLREESKSRRLKIKQMEDEENKRLQEEREKAGEFETLYGDAKNKLDAQLKELESLRELKAGVDAEVETQRQAILKELPDDTRTAFDNASLAQLNALQATLKNNPSASQGGNRDDARDDTSDASSGSKMPALAGRDEDILNSLEKNKG